MPLNKDIKKVLVIGSGPIVIGQAAEFDYAGAQACRVLRDEGIEVVLVNSNPATIMTDKALADHIYLEPLTKPFYSHNKQNKDIPPRITSSLQNLLLCLRLNKEKTEDLPLLRFPDGEPYDPHTKNC